MEMSNLPPRDGRAVPRTLHQAARDGDVNIMRSLLDELGNDTKIKINQLDENKFSPLHYAAKYTFYNMVVCLVDRGADVNIKGENGLTPLHFAAWYMTTTRESTAVQSETATLQRGMSSDSTAEPKSPDSNTSYSVPNSIISYLLSKGASVNAKNSIGLTPLHYSAMRRNELSAKVLLQCPRIKIEARDIQEMTPLHTATINNCSEVVRCLTESNADLCCKDRTEATPLHRASAQGNIKIVNLLLDAAFSRCGRPGVKQLLNHRDSSHNLPLHVAIVNVNVKVVELLIREGSDVSAEQYNASSPLHLAAVSGSEQIVKLLLENNADVNIANASQKTPLHIAADYNHTGIIEILLKNGAEIEKRSKDNFTPLLIAASKGHVESLWCLLHQGANITAVDKDGKTPLNWAMERNHHEALKTLMCHERCKELLDCFDCHENRPLHTAAMKWSIPIVQCLLDHGAPVDHRNAEGETPLHVAAKEGRTKAVKELLSRCEQLISTKDGRQNTALHLAALAGKYNVIRILLDSGADVKLRNTKNWTALDCACAEGWLRSVKVLLENNSAVDPPPNIKTTPLHLAVERGHVKVAEFLMKSGARVTRTDESGRNALEIAIKSSQEYVAMAIINSDQWQDALRNNSTCDKTKMRITPLHLLILKLPDVAEQVFNKCITTSTTDPSEDQNFAVTFNYEFIDDTYIVHNKAVVDDMDQENVKGVKYTKYDEEQCLKPGTKPYSKGATFIKERHPLMIMVNSKRKQLLGHPLCTNLVNYKWRQYGSYVYMTNLAFYGVFLTFLTGYLLTTPKPTLELGTHSITNSSQFSCEEIKRQHVFVYHSMFTTYGQVMIMMLCSLMMLKECFQALQLRLRYLTFENLLEWSCYFSALLLVIDVDCISAATGHRKVWQWELGAISIFFAWLELVMFIRKFSFLGIYVVMLIDVFTTFVKVFVVFILLIIGFSLSFSTAFYNQEMMLAPGKALLRTSVMMLGEFNFDDMFEDNKILFPAPSYIIFIAFIVLMTIITMNLLVGLAVDNIKGVQEQAELSRLAMRVKLVLDVESLLPEFFRRRFIVSEQVVKPNKRSHRYIKHLMSGLENMELIAHGGSKLAVKPEVEKAEQRHEAIMCRVTQMQKYMKHLQEENQGLKSMMLALIRNNGLQWEEEDDPTDIEETSAPSHR